MTSNKSVSKDKDFNIALYTGAMKTITQIDLSKYNVKFIHIDSSEWLQYLSTLNPKVDLKSYVGYFTDKIKDHYYVNNIFALVPISFTRKLPSEDLISQVQDFLLIMFPSDFRLIVSMYFTLFARGEFYSGYARNWELRKVDHSLLYKDFLQITPKEAKEGTAFFKVIVKRIDKIKYLNICYNSYILHFSIDSYYLSYINLFIGLESLIEGKTEVTFKIKRLCAVLLGNNIQASQQIFKNVGHCYELRSSIVHGQKYKQEILKDYFYILRDIVSRVIIEIILLNIPTKEAFDKYIIASGFAKQKRKSIEICHRVHQLTYNPIKLNEKGIVKENDK